MEFTITCPIDGQVDVSLEDIDTVVLRDSDRADITFVCPHCGTEITVSAIVPSFLLAAMEALAEEPDAPGGDFVSGSSPAPEPFMGIPTMTGVTPLGRPDEETPPVDESDPRFDAYCEYFRRQLSHIDSVEDALHEIDSKA